MNGSDAARAAEMIRKEEEHGDLPADIAEEMRKDLLKDLRGDKDAD